ncbi:putative surface antigen [Magnetofaba australis IT-1]|uniref:Putative surface antigen n=2 Tax=Magnetofaba TaxID=1472292 RepID=A0A1Y2JZG6_9PROT|nr:putative surface antigen [Magnetofaba australis IT-1]
MRHIFPPLLLTLLWALCPALAPDARAADAPQSSASQPAATQPADAPPTVSQRAAYSVAFDGLDKHGDLEKLIGQVAQTVLKQEKPPLSRFLLARMADGDAELAVQAMRSRGYLDARAEAAVSGEAPPFVVTLKAAPGPLYHIAQWRVQTTPPGDEFTPPDAFSLGLDQAPAGESARILEAHDKLVDAAKEQGYAYAKAGKMRVVADPKSHALEVIYAIDLGPLTTLGEPQLQGFGSVKESYLLHRIPWKAGVRYAPARLREARKAMVGTGLFSAARVKLSETPDAEGRTPVVIKLIERKHRTWRAGAGFSTDQGVTLSGSWEHRNFRGGGERLLTEAELAQQTMRLAASYDQPDFRHIGETLRLSTEIAQEEEEGYDRTGLDINAAVIKKLPKIGELTLGAEYSVARVTEITTAKEETYGTMSFPVGLAADLTDDRLDATRGWKMTLISKPVLATLGNGSNYWRFDLGGSAYHRVGFSDKRLVLAGRFALGTTIGAELADIPADNRLYAGGGGSVRGYGYQLAGPVDAANNPTGGRSLLTFGFESRYRVRPNIGVVAFVDGGRAYAAAFPDGSADPLIGAGLGLRYASPLGPLRLDVGVPLRQRDGVDDVFQLYMSIGQAF